jgi:hypothetical protein
LNEEHHDTTQPPSDGEAIATARSDLPDDAPAVPAGIAQGDVADKRFLTEERIQALGNGIAPLLRDLSWIERRKETVVILDDTALQRQISVDFSLRGGREPVLEKDASLGNLYYAPVFALPKSPSNLMAFDLTDESGAALHLISRQDNGRISGAALESMAQETLVAKQLNLPADLAAELQRLATGDAASGKQIARQLCEGPVGAWQKELSVLRDDERFLWWLETLAHSSIVVVLFRSPRPRRKLIKMRFEEPIQAEQPILARFGWAPYRVGIESSLIGARSYHFEVQAPPGLRIAEAALSDDSGAEPVAERGALRRVHLYREDASAAGAGTAVLWLTVSGLGFVSGAVLAAVLGFSALLACLLAAPRIATNPTSAPALLLALPALIASYVARSDQHALTTRLLAFARWLLLFTAFFAYVAAGKVALSGSTPSNPKEIAARTDSLRIWLWPLTVLAFLSAAGLAVTWLRARSDFTPWRNSRFRATHLIAGKPDVIRNRIKSSVAPTPVPEGYDLEEEERDGALRFIRVDWMGVWSLTLRCIGASSRDTHVEVEGVYAPYNPGRIFAPWLLEREAEKVQTGLDALETWALSED